MSIKERAENYIHKLVPRKPQRLNEISQRFEQVKQRHQALNSAVQDLTAKQPVPSLTKGAINLNEETTLTFQSVDAKASTSIEKQPFSAIDTATQLIGTNKDKPIKFISQITNKPVHPPYLELADFESYVKA